MESKQLAHIPADEPGIFYWGTWDVQASFSLADIPMSTCMFCFRGDSVSLTAEVGPNRGIALIRIDCGELLEADCYAPEVSVREIFKAEHLPNDQMHFLRVAVCRKFNPASSGRQLKLCSFEACEIVHYEDEMNQKMNEEYSQILSLKKEWAKPDTWKPVPYQAEAPSSGVKLLTSSIRDLFLQNAWRVMYDFRLPDYCEGDPPGCIRTGHGWSDFLPASNEGRILAGAANTLCWENIPGLREIVDKVVSDIGKRMRSDGYYNYYSDDLFAVDFLPGELKKNVHFLFAFFSERKNYDRVFWTRGMIAAAAAGNKEALPLLRRMYDWFNSQEQYLSHLLLGGNATNAFPGGPLVYHTPVGKPEDIITSERFLDQEYWFRALREKHPVAFSHYTGERPHSYCLLQLEALADEYRATGNQTYLDTLLSAWEVYRDSYTHIGGASAINESVTPHPPMSYYLTKTLNGETCGSVFWIWVNHRLLQLFPNEEKYAAEMEASLYNVILQCRTRIGTTIIYNRLQGRKTEDNNCNGCCEVSSTMLISSLPQYIYSINPHEIYVNLFVPSVITAEGITLRMDTAFPESGTVSLKIQSETEQKMTVKVRIPSWIPSDIAICVNGNPEVIGVRGTYALLERVWKTGDEITVELPMEWKIREYLGLEQEENGKPRYALLRGPILMALVGDYPDEDLPRLPFTAEQLPANLHRYDRGLEYTVDGLPGFHYRPYYAVEKEQFCCFPVFEDR